MRLILFMVGLLPLLAVAEPAPNSQTFVLHPVADGFELPYHWWTPENPPPVKRPAAAAPTSIQGQLPRSWAQTDQMVLLLDQDARTLYLDLNLNNDLTDDGVFHADDKGLYQIHYSLDETGSVNHATLHPDDLHGSMHTLIIHSGWQGEGDLAGRRWRFRYSRRFADEGNMPFFTLEPADSPVFHAEKLRDEYQNPHRFRNQYVLGQTVYAWRIEHKGTDVIVTADAQPIPVREVQFTGTDVFGICCTSSKPLSDKRTVGWNGPPTIVALAEGNHAYLPVDNYRDYSVVVRNAGYFTTMNYSGLDVGADKPVVVEAGGPIVPHLTTSQFQTRLMFNYTLEGAGRRKYQPLEPATPTLTVTQEGGTVFAAQMEPG